MVIYYKGLCSRDAKAHGHEYEGVRVSMLDRLDDWRVYKARGLTVREASVKMGMQPKSLGQILARAKREGKL